MFKAVRTAVQILLGCGAVVAVVIALLIALAIAAETYLRASGSDRLLDVMRQLRPGTTKGEVRRLLDKEPSVRPAGEVPQWIEDAVPNRVRGEFWFFFMGYPPRNLIIYFDENERVAYTTWAPT
jgi:hypothetical protein